MMRLQLDRRGKLELGVWLILAICTTLLFWFTDLDIKAAKAFFHLENGNDPWPERHWWVFQLLFDHAFVFTIASAGIALLVYVLSFFSTALLGMRRKALYILLVIAIGPGLVVNMVFKDHWGRPRPMHIHEFGGEYQYLPPLQMGNTPDKSFVCGHCSVSFSFIALYFLAQHHKLFYLVLTLALGWIMGYTRMSAGGHFISDVLWSGYLVFLVAFALYYGWYRPNLILSARQS